MNEKIVVSIVGHSNVGKSTLINRLTLEKNAIVEDQPNITRDIIKYEANIDGIDFIIKDTGGFEKSDDDEMSSLVYTQTEKAIRESDILLLVFDVKTGVSEDDYRIVEKVRNLNKPIVVAVNKVDSELDESLIWEFQKLGLPTVDIIGISALHRKNIYELIEKLIFHTRQKKDKESQISKGDTTGEEIGKNDNDRIHSIAIIGKPNVGKSSLLNKLSNDDVSIVSAIEGTTRDSVNETINLAGKTYNFIDTAGIKRKSNKLQGVDYYSILRAQNSIERSDLCLILLDGSQEISSQDLRLVSLVIEEGKAIVLVVNKWDLLDGDRKRYIDVVIEDEFYSSWLTRINISAKSGRGLDKIPKAIEKALESWGKRVPTARVNNFIRQLQSMSPHPVVSGKQPKIKYISQVATEPPKFLLSVSQELNRTYVRFIERRIREEFKFGSTPIVISTKVTSNKKNIKK
jgi:GTP-binding protein